MSEDSSADYDEICMRNETKIIANLNHNLKNISQDIISDSKLYGLPIFWDLI